MSDYKINGQVVSESAWNSFRASLVSDFPASKACFDDHSITRDEIIGVLDADGNKILTSKDFIGVDAARFSRVSDILKRHGFSLGAEAANNTHHIYDIRSAPPYLLSDRDFVLAAVKQNGMALHYADPKFKKDKSVVLAAVNQNTMAIEYMDPSLKADREIALAWVKQEVWALGYIESSLVNDPNFIFDAARINVGILDSRRVGAAARDGAWKLLLKEYNNFSELEIPRQSLASYQSFKKFIRERYDIEFLGRFRSIAVLVEVLKIRINPTAPSDKRPTAVLIFPKIDKNEAFQMYPTIDRLVELGYRVKYYEVGDEVSAERRLGEATSGGDRKADVIVLAGHGISEALSLGGDGFDVSEGRLAEETKFIDAGDFRPDGVDVNLPKYLSPTGDLVLDSCSNGEGGEGNPKNLANTMARIMPKGVRIHASTLPMKIKDISMAGDSSMLQVKWTTHSLYTISGRTSGDAAIHKK